MEFDDLGRNRPDIMFACRYELQDRGGYLLLKRGVLRWTRVTVELVQRSVESLAGNGMNRPGLPGGCLV